MSQNHSYAIQELHKKIENLSLAHDKLCAIVSAQSHIIKTLKSYHADDFRQRKEEQIKRKNELLTKKNQRTSNTSSTINRNSQYNKLERKTFSQPTQSQQSFDAEYEEMKKQVTLLQSQLSHLTTLPQNTSTSVQNAPVPVASNSSSTTAPAPTTI